MDAGTILAVISLFVCLALVAASFLAGVVFYDFKARAEIVKKLDEAYTAMEQFAQVNNENVSKMGTVITELQEKVQAHDIRLAGGVVKSGPFARQ